MLGVHRLAVLVRAVYLLLAVVDYVVGPAARQIPTRQEYHVEQLCAKNLHPVIQIAPDGPLPSAILLSLGKSPRWPTPNPSLLDCSISLQTPSPNGALGVSFSRLQLRLGNSLECIDFIEVNDGHNSVRLCGEIKSSHLGIIRNVPTRFDSEHGLVNLRIVSAPFIRSLPEAPANLGFTLSAVAYFRASSLPECDSFQGFYCSVGGRCLPKRIICDGFRDCGEVIDDTDEVNNCTAPPNFRRRDVSRSTKINSTLVTVVVVASLLVVFFSVSLYFCWRRRKVNAGQQFIERSSSLDPVLVLPSSSTSDLSVPPIPPPRNFAVAPDLSRQSSLNAPSEAPPTYESLFGFSGFRENKPK